MKIFVTSAIQTAGIDEKTRAILAPLKNGEKKKKKKIKPTPPSPLFFFFFFFKVFFFPPPNPRSPVRRSSHNADLDGVFLVKHKHLALHDQTARQTDTPLHRVPMQS